MIFVVDIGNTNIVISIFEEDNILFKFRINTDKTLTADQYSIQIKSMLDIYGVNIGQIKDCVICSVVPSVLPIFKQAILTLIKKSPFIIEYGIKTGLNIMIDYPDKLGNDLVANAVAGLNEFNPPLIIVDMGTATTFSIIDQNKNYLGGLIIPGVKISLDALSNKAQQLPFISLDKPKNIIGKNTIECMQSGLIYGSATLIDGMIEMLQADIGKKATVIVTGGIAKQIVPFCKSDILYDEDLILKGTYLLYKKNY